MTLFAHVLFAAISIPFVLATSGGGGGNWDNNSACPSGQFRWVDKNVCLPYNGNWNPPNPPSGTSCPSNWSWFTGTGCCAPHQPPVNLPPPQCSGGWNWLPAACRCSPSSSTTTPGAQQPSRVPPGGGGSWKRAAVPGLQRDHARSISPCPAGLRDCPVISMTEGDYECVDISVDLDNCGGCAVSGEGQNCNAIAGVWNVGCEEGTCKIYTCEQGYRVAADGHSCVAH